MVQRDAFIVRIWREAGQSVWRGWVQHVRTGEEVCVGSLDALTAFIERRTWRQPDSPVSTSDTSNTGLR